MRLKKLTAFVLAGAVALSVALTGCGSSIDENVVGATLNGEEISLGFMNFVAKYQQAISDLSYLSMFGPKMWSTEITEGVTMEDSTKDSVLTLIEVAYLLEDHMGDYGVEITQEDTEAIEAAAKQFMADNSSKAIRQMGASEEYVKEMLRLFTIQWKMQNAVYEASEATVTDQEAAQRTFSYIRVSATSGTGEDGTAKEYTEEEKEAFASEMEAIAADAKENFDGVAQEQGYTVSSYSYGEDESSMDEAVIAAADALKEGEISDLITTDSYYYVLRLDSELDQEKTEEKRTSLLEQKKQEEYTALCDGYKEAADFEVNQEEWAKVKFNRLFGAPASEEAAQE